MGLVPSGFWVEAGGAGAGVDSVDGYVFGGQNPEDCQAFDDVRRFREPDCGDVEWFCRDYDREFGANVRRPAVKRQPRVVPNSFLYSTNGSEAWAVHSKMTWASVFLRKTDW